MRKTPHSIREVIEAAGEAKKEDRYGPAIHISMTSPPNVNKSAPHNLRRRSATLRAAKRAWKRSVKPAAGETRLTERKALPVSASALQ
jgi:hypothetical protein